LFVLTWLDRSPVRSGSYRPVFKRFYWLLVADVILLGWAGGRIATPMIVAISQIATAYYFAHFLIILPLISRFEKPHPLPNSISESVLHGEAAEAAPAGMKPGRGGSQATVATAG
jgi:ubiquinol-cytochrome c reductase cytochrome b subunit